VFEALQLFDDSRQMLYGWLHTVEVEIATIDVYSDQAGPKIVAVAETFGELAAQIVNEATDKVDAQDCIASVWRDDDAQRMFLFNGLTGCVCFDNGSIEYQPEDSFDEDEDGDNEKDMPLDNITIAFDQAEVHGVDLSEAIENAYTAVASKEIGELFGHLAYGSLQFHENDLKAVQPRQEQPEQEQEVIMRLTYPAVAEKVISYSFDVAKIAIGAGIALWFSRKMQDRA
jgi:hypothetical protein